MNGKSLWILILAGPLWLGFSLGITAEKSYYDGKTLKIIVSSSPGGGTDTTARLVAPKGTPDDVVRLLREAFAKMRQDPEFEEHATKFFGTGWSVGPGEKAEALIREVTTVSPETMNFLAKIRKKYGLPAEEPKKKK